MVNNISKENDDHISYQNCPVPTQTIFIKLIEYLFREKMFVLSISKYREGFYSTESSIW